MKKFTKKIIWFIAPFFIYFFAIIYIYINNSKNDSIPAINFSNSYSFNEKIRFMKTKDKTASILAIGSSMTLDNLDSKTILANLNIGNYINAASWGMSIYNDYIFLKSLSKIYNIKCVIISSNIIDFKTPGINVDFQFIENYLESDNYSIVTFEKFINTFSPKYYMKNFSYVKKVRNDSTQIEYLNYDNFGAVSFPKDNFNINKKRWVADNLDSPCIELQYNYLDSISNYCKINKIELLFFQSPYREGIWNNFNSSKLNELNLHIKRIKSILKSDNHFFVNSNEKLWPDSLFCDATHMNCIGAQLYTKFCFDKKNSLIIKK